MIKPLWKLSFEFKEHLSDSSRFDELYVAGFDISEAYQNGTRAVASLNYINVSIIHIERTFMKVALED